MHTETRIAVIFCLEDRINWLATGMLYLLSVRKLATEPVKEYQRHSILLSSHLPLEVHRLWQQFFVVVVFAEHVRSRQNTNSKLKCVWNLSHKFRSMLGALVLKQNKPSQNRILKEVAIRTAAAKRWLQNQILFNVSKR